MLRFRSYTYKLQCFPDIFSPCDLIKYPLPRLLFPAIAFPYPRLLPFSSLPSLFFSSLPFPPFFSFLPVPGKCRVGITTLKVLLQLGDASEGQRDDEKYIGRRSRHHFAPRNLISRISTQRNPRNRQRPFSSIFSTPPSPAEVTSNRARWSVRCVAVGQGAPSPTKQYVIVHHFAPSRRYLAGHVRSRDDSNWIYGPHTLTPV